MAQIKKDFQKVISDDAEFREAVSGNGTVLIDVHPSWCGPCECIRPQLWKLALEDETLKFCTASSDKVPILSKDFSGKVKPVFLVYKNGKPSGEPIEGVNGPEIVRRLTEGA